MDVSSVQGNAQAAAAAAHDQSRANMLVQKVLRNPNPSEADKTAALAAARDGGSDGGAQQAGLAAIVGKGSHVNTYA